MKFATYLQIMKRTKAGNIRRGERIYVNKEKDENTKSRPELDQLLHKHTVSKRSIHKGKTEAMIMAPSL